MCAVACCAQAVLWRAVGPPHQEEWFHKELSPNHAVCCAMLCCGVPCVRLTRKSGSTKKCANAIHCDVMRCAVTCFAVPCCDVVCVSPSPGRVVPQRTEPACPKPPQGGQAQHQSGSWCTPEVQHTTVPENQVHYNSVKYQGLYSILTYSTVRRGTAWMSRFHPQTPPPHPPTAAHNGNFCFCCFCCCRCCSCCQHIFYDPL